MTAAERARLIDFLRRKQCGPCRRGDLDSTHAGCVEAADLIDIVELSSQLRSGTLRPATPVSGTGFDQLSRCP